ncbi:ribonuclease P [Thermoplasma sp. Kam2015]|uniref:ribonuclease P n=1 Tax=Thermoplasma sp. Kam2015 TaxID=2094122 RepID=UPI000D9538EB|nr:ribonuclease P [Thermoplasma sp. Kam2015]PYB67795.1 ribonuclease P [Thermoplasma sp. Kam2015]
MLITKKDIEAIARSRIDKLHRYALNTGDRRYIIQMERIAKRMDITLPAIIKRSYCKRCKNPYRGEIIRIKKNLVTVKCPVCGDIRRFQINR